MHEEYKETKMTDSQSEKEFLTISAFLEQHDIPMTKTAIEVLEKDLLEYSQEYGHSTDSIDGVYLAFEKEVLEKTILP